MIGVEKKLIKTQGNFTLYGSNFMIKVHGKAEIDVIEKVSKNH